MMKAVIIENNPEKNIGLNSVKIHMNKLSS